MTDTITKQEPKLSVRKPGVWRNKWTDSEGGWSRSMGRWVSPGEQYVPSQSFTSAAAAETSGERTLKIWKPYRPSLSYLGPVHFPDEGDQ